MNQQILSQDEVDALLQGITGESQKLEQEEQVEGSIRNYDLANQERIVRGRMPTMEIIGERFARNIRIGLFNFIRKSPEVSINGIKVQKYSAFLREIVVPTNFNIVSVRPLRGSGLIVCDPSLVFAVIDALFGGVGKFHTRIEGRDFSPTEQRVIQRLVDCIITEYRNAWQGIYPLDLEYQRSEMQPQFANIATPSEIVVASSFTLEVGETSGSVHFCIPYSTLEPIRDVLVFDDPGRLGGTRSPLGQPAQGADPVGRGGPRGRAGHRTGDGGAVAVVQARRLRRAGPGSDDPGQGRRGSGVRLPLRHVDRQVRDQDRSLVDQLEPELAGRWQWQLKR